MNEKDFSEYVQMRHKNYVGEKDVLAAIGLAGEAGEVLEWYKKVHFLGRHKPDIELFLEMGDVLHYFTLLAAQWSLSLDEIRQMNVDKLAMRDLKVKACLSGCYP